MSDKIFNIDFQQGTKQAWHGKTEVVSPKDFTLQSCKLAKLEFTSIPLYLKQGESFIPASAGTDDQGKEVSFAILQDNETKAFLGSPYNPTTFFPFSNQEFISAIAEATSDIKGIKLSSCGTHSRRSCVYVSFDITEASANFSLGTHKFNSMLNIGRGVTGLEAVWSNTSTFDTVCANTFGMNKNLAISGQKAGNPVCVYFKQTKNSKLKLENMARVIDSSLGLVAQFKQAMEILGNQKAKEEQAREFYAGFLVNGNKPSRISTRAENTRERLVQLFRGGAGNIGQSRLDIFSGITDFYSHESSGGDNTWKQFVSSEFGSASRIKEESLPLLLDNDKFKATVELGRNSIKLTADLDAKVREFEASLLN